jgi:outer membrane usher protein
MRRRLSAVRQTALVALIVAVAIAPAIAATSESESEAVAGNVLLLDVVVNNYPAHRAVEFVTSGGALSARRQDLRDLGIRVPAAAATVGEFIALAALAGVTSRIDTATQTLYLAAPSESLEPTLLDLDRHRGPGAGLDSGTGASLDYDVVATAAGGQRFASGHLDLRAFSPVGVVATGLLVFAGNDGRTGAPAIRLDSNYVYSDVGHGRRYLLGDFISGGLYWTRPVRMGGARITSDFSMRPDLITFPQPTVSGSVAVPSTLDVLVNGSQVGSREVPPGPFQIPQLPVVTGAGEIALTVTDALGRQVTTSQSFYASASLLAPGLQTWSADVGVLRHGWGAVSNDYGTLAATGAYRRGLSSHLTIEGYAELAHGLVMAGGGVAANVADFATLNVTAAGSTADGHSGGLVTVGIQRISRGLSFGLSATLAGHRFRDIAAANGEPYPYRQVIATAGSSLGRFGSVSAAFAVIDRDGNLLANRPGDAPDVNGKRGEASHLRLATASYATRIRNLAVHANGFNDFAQDKSYGLQVGISMPLGPRTSMSSSAGWGAQGSYGQSQSSQTAVSVGDWGYQVYAATGRPDHEFAEAEYKSPFAAVRGGVDRMGSQLAFHAAFEGSVTFAGGGFFASNHISDSFAIVDTHGAKGIRVLLENRFAGVTDRSGRLLVPDLRSFDVNHLAIDPLGAPLDAAIPVTSAEVTPQDRSGVVVNFPVTVSRSALLRLTGQSGQPLPVGSIATLVQSGLAFPVGFDGEAYLDGLAIGVNALSVALPGRKTCLASFTYEPVANDIPTIGPVLCAEPGW